MKQHRETGKSVASSNKSVRMDNEATSTHLETVGPCVQTGTVAEGWVGDVGL